MLLSLEVVVRHEIDDLGSGEGGMTLLCTEVMVRRVDIEF